MAIALAGLLGVGVTLVGAFPGSGEALEDGTAAYHGLGAFTAFLSGNALLVLLGRGHASFGIGRRAGRALMLLGALGFASLVAFVADLSADAGVLIGLVERGVVYPVVIGLAAVGAALRRRAVNPSDR